MNPIDAELRRKALKGLKPTNPENMERYNQINDSIQNNQIMSDFLAQERERIRTGLGNMGGLLTARGRQSALENIYRSQRDQIADDRYVDERDYGRGRDKLADQRYDQQRDYQIGRDKIGDQQWDKQFNFNANQALQQLAISRMNANTSRMSSNRAGSNAALDQLMDIWKMTGKAPQGIPGVEAGTEMYGLEDTKQDPYDQAMAKAISLAQKDPKWFDGNKEELVKQYYELFAPQPQPAPPPNPWGAYLPNVSDDDITGYLKKK